MCAAYISLLIVKRREIGNSVVADLIATVANQLSAARTDMGF